MGKEWETGALNYSLMFGDKLLNVFLLHEKYLIISLFFILMLHSFRPFM